MENEMNELIEKLKDKNYVRAFGLLELREQECLRKAGRKGCLYYGSKGWKEKCADDTFAVYQTYAIKPDYQPEPEYEDVEIKVFSTNRLGIVYRQKCFTNPNSIMIPLHELPSLPNFEGFWFDTDTGTRFNFTDDGPVATYRDEGKTVYASFRRV